jgi:glycogen operon protein
MRDFWRGEAGPDAFAARFTGSADLYEADGRDPFASINFITAHDGFTLRDLVSYNDKHNEANKEDNRDGTDDNRSWNHGAEGPTDDPEISALRARQIRNFLTTLVLSSGTPMLLGGDEIGRTQQGNNNGWCQDSEISWYDWELGPEQQRLLEFTRSLIALRHAHPVLHRSSFLAGEETEGSGLPDAWWFRADGNKMTSADWRSGQPAVGLFLNGDEIAYRSRRGRRITDDSFLLLVNGGHEPETMRLPVRRFGGCWEVAVATDADLEVGTRFDAHTEVTMQSRSMLVMMRVVD